MQMNMDRVKESLNNAWNKSLMQIGGSLFVVIFLLELLILAVSYQTGNLHMPVLEYIQKKMLLPVSIQAVLIGNMYLVYKDKIGWLKGKRKEGFLCYSIFFVLVVCALANQYYLVLAVTPCVCLYLHSVYAEKREVRQIYQISNLFVLVCTVLAFRNGDYKWDYLLMTFVCAIGMMYIIYSVAGLLSGFHAEQLEYLQESYKQQEELIRELQIDPMTGLYNKNNLLKKLNLITEKQNKNMGASYLAILDLDYFKKVNDTYGHVSGDTVICRLAELIKGYMNENTEGFRFGGEEFILIFSDSKEEEVLTVLREICRIMRESVFEFDEGLRITLSAGVSRYKAGMDYEMWLGQADEALYYVKNHGRNQMKLVR